MEQAFQNRMRFLRCHYEFQEHRGGVPHAPEWRVEVRVTRPDGVHLTAHGSLAGNKKDARRSAIAAVAHQARTIPDPCTQGTMPFARLWETVQKPVCAFAPPPADWFAEAQVLGVDWEGSPPRIVQIACARGVYIDVVGAPAAARVLRDTRHTHCIFGAHEAALVAVPRNVQRADSQPLVEAVSVAFMPTVRFTKDKEIHRRTNYWRTRPLSQEALEYAALDAEMTRRLGISQPSTLP